MANEALVKYLDTYLPEITSFSDLRDIENPTTKQYVEGTFLAPLLAGISSSLERDKDLPEAFKAMSETDLGRFISEYRDTMMYTLDQYKVDGKIPEYINGSLTSTRAFGETYFQNLVSKYPDPVELVVPSPVVITPSAPEEPPASSPLENGDQPPEEAPAPPPMLESRTAMIQKLNDLRKDWANEPALKDNTFDDLLPGNFTISEESIKSAQRSAFSAKNHYKGNVFSGLYFHVLCKNLVEGSALSDEEKETAREKICANIKKQISYNKYGVIHPDDQDAATKAIYDALSGGVVDDKPFQDAVKDFAKAVVINKDELRIRFAEAVLGDGNAAVPEMEDFLKNWPDTCFVNQKVFQEIINLAKQRQAEDAEKHPLGEYRGITAFIMGIKEKGYLRTKNATGKNQYDSLPSVTENLISFMEEKLKDAPLYEGVPEDYRNSSIGSAVYTATSPQWNLDSFTAGIEAMKKGTLQEAEELETGNSQQKRGFKDAKTTLIAAGSMAAVGAAVGLTGGEKKQPEDGVEEEQAPKKSSWFTPRRIIAGLLIVGASYLAFQAAKGNDPIGNFTRGLFGGGDKKEQRGRL